MWLKQTLIAVGFVVIFANVGFAQIRRVDSHLLYERVLAIVPLVGKGTPADPIRPMFVSAPSSLDPASLLAAKPQRPAADLSTKDPVAEERKRKTQILAYSWQPSDDKKFALVEYVARDKAAFEEIKKSPLAKVFARDEIGRVLAGRQDLSRDNVELEFQKLKKDFKLSYLRTVVP